MGTPYRRLNLIINYQICISVFTKAGLEPGVNDCESKDLEIKLIWKIIHGLSYMRIIWYGADIRY